MNPQVTFDKSRKHDLTALARLLSECELPVEDLHQDRVEFLVARDGNQIIGCIGLERYGNHGLLRSFAVQPESRDSGVGTQLLEYYLKQCGATGIEQLHLLTTTAGDYFLKKGFKISRRDQAPESIRSTSEFSELCPSSSTYMTIDLH